MQKIDPITDSAEDVFISCIDNMKDRIQHAKLLLIKDEIVRHDAEFSTAAGQCKFYEIVEHNTVGGNVTTKEMEWVYDNRMVDSVSGRVYYDKIMAIPKHSICPLCAHGLVSTLDHYLPKAKFPGLAVSPRNLLPACMHCNTTKSAAVATCATKQTINPYYDTIENDSWLSAKFRQRAPVVIEFYVSKAAGWNETIVRRVRHHFASFKLARLYSLQAASELEGIKKTLTNILDKRGRDEVRNHLQDQADSRGDVNKNSWQAALYRALAASDWFCRVGCRG